MSAERIGNPRNKGGRGSFTSLISMAILFVLLLISPSFAQTTYEARNATVSPDYGYVDFTYSSQIEIAGDNTDVSGKFKVKLKIYNEGNLVQEEASLERRLSSDEMGAKLSDPFVFGPYNFERDFGIANTSNATFEFIVYKSGSEVARVMRRGPTVENPAPIIQYDDSPYFVQSLSVSASFKDMEGLTPSCHLEISGPFGSDEERSWKTKDVSCKGAGNVYTCTVTEDLSPYQEGGNFSFLLVYNNLRLDPIVDGPHNFTVGPYEPTVELFQIPPELDYNDFSIKAYVDDLGRNVVGGIPVGSSAKVVMTHPGREPIQIDRSQPRIEGGYLVFEWDEEDIKLNRSDVNLSKIQPFEGWIEYKNDNWNYDANSTKVSFAVVEEVPILKLSYDPTVYVREGEMVDQEIKAIVCYSKGAGDLVLEIDGPNFEFEDSSRGSELGEDERQYEWQVRFNESHMYNNYTLSLTYIHSSVEGGAYRFEDRTVQVLPVYVDFEEASVDPRNGCWNDTFRYSVQVNSSAEMDVALQTYNPCELEWVDWSSRRASCGKSTLDWAISPFGYECDEMGWTFSKYRFKARFEGVEYGSRAYSGPTFSGKEPILSDLGYHPVVYVSKGSDTSQEVQAVVECVFGMGELELAIKGPGMEFEDTKRGVPLGGDRYLYEWNVPFDETHAHNNYILYLTYIHPSVEGGALNFTDSEDRIMQVLPISVEFEEAFVSPEEGCWNDTFHYSVQMNSSAEMDIVLQTYNPCSYEWEDWGAKEAHPGESSLNWSISPFWYKCAEMDQNIAKYRFKVTSGDFDHVSRAYPGPDLCIIPKLVDLDFERVIYVSEGSEAYQVIWATVEYCLGMGDLNLAITGPNMNFNNKTDGVDLGGNRYLYTWHIPFNEDNEGDHRISLSYAHPSLEGSEHLFEDYSMEVITEADDFSEPKLVDLVYEPLIFVDKENDTDQIIGAKVFSPEGRGELVMNLTGPDKRLENSIAGESVDGIYVYNWSIPFNWTNAHNSYKISLTYVLRGEAYTLGDRLMTVVPQNGESAPAIWEPTLNLEYDRTLYIPEEGSANQIISATINYPLVTSGELVLNLAGPDKRIENTSLGKYLGDNRSLYEWQVPFERKNAEKTYKISLKYNHTGLPNGGYKFADRYMRVEASSESAADIVEFKNGMVTPENGSVFVSYTYCVEINTSLPSCDVALQILDPGSSIWASRGIVQYDGSDETLCWPNVQVGSNKDGQAKYRFVCGKSTSEAYSGPDLQVPSVEGTVEPTRGIVESFSAEENDLYPFVYTARFENWSLEENLWVELLVKAPNSNWVTVGARKQYDPSEGRVTWTVKPFSDPRALERADELLGKKTEFKFLINGIESEVFEGPEIEVIYGNLNFGEMGSKYKYMANVNSTQNLTIDLMYSQDNLVWTNVKKPQNYVASSGQKTMTWTSLPAYYFYELDIEFRELEVEGKDESV